MELEPAAELLAALLGVLNAALSFQKTFRRRHDHPKDDHTGPGSAGAASEHDPADGDAPRGAHGQRPDGPQE